MRSGQETCEVGDTCLPELKERNFSILFLSMPLNSDQCRQSFVGLLTTSMAYSGGGERLFGKLIRPLTCEVREPIPTVPISTVPHRMH